ncbi:MAG: preprotein translocase subunit SecE [Thermodesulfovibrionales bacterium]|nr:preprotein translocase subunit SecE [Thermodesulfovibrionales bacterium]
MFKRIKDFIGEVKVEIKKVVFPSKDELLGSTWVVVATVLIMSVFLGIIDLSLAKLIRMALR